MSESSDGMGNEQVRIMGKGSFAKARRAEDGGSGGTETSCPYSIEDYIIRIRALLGASGCTTFHVCRCTYSAHVHPTTASGRLRCTPTPTPPAGLRIESGRTQS